MCLIILAARTGADDGSFFANPLEVIGPHFGGHVFSLLLLLLKSKPRFYYVTHSIANKESSFGANHAIAVVPKAPFLMKIALRRSCVRPAITTTLPSIINILRM